MARSYERKAVVGPAVHTQDVIDELQRERDDKVREIRIYLRVIAMQTVIRTELQDSVATIANLSERIGELREQAARETEGTGQAAN